MAFAGGVKIGNVRLMRAERLVFDGLSLDLAERRIGLVGDNGSGKSSLLRLVNGLLAPDSGHVTTAGLDTRKDRRALPAKVGFVFQNPDHQIIFPSVGEEVAFGLRESGMDAKAAAARASALLAEHGCAGWEDRGIHELSDGQKQRVCILATIAPAPEILLLDEPFSALDLPSRFDLIDLIARLPQQIVMASHDLDLFAGFDRVLWIAEGRIRGDGRPADIIAAYRADVLARRNTPREAAS